MVLQPPRLRLQIPTSTVATVNLAQARLTEKHEDIGQATILLPQPEVLQPRVDYRRSRTWEVRRMVWLPWNADQDRPRDAVMAQP